MSLSVFFCALNAFLQMYDLTHVSLWNPCQSLYNQMESPPQRIFLSAPGVFQAKPIQKASWGVSFKRVMCSDFLSLFLPLNFWRMCMSLNASAWERVRALKKKRQPQRRPVLRIQRHLQDRLCFNSVRALLFALNFGSDRFVISWARDGEECLFFFLRSCVD